MTLTDRMSDEVINKTRDMYVGWISQPPMEPKYLAKPPFPWILKIVEQVQAKTNFANGLFTPAELTKEYYENAQLKTMFLKKIHAVVKAVTGPFELAPASVLAGQDVDKTHVFLQKLAEGAKSGANTDDIVRKILDKIGGKSIADAPVKQPTASETTAQAEQPAMKSHADDVNRMAREAAAAGNGGNTAAEEADSKIRMGNLRANKQKSNIIESKLNNETVIDVGQAASIDSMKTMIQSINQSVNPMGKIIQFIDDDIDSMKREYDSWAKIHTAAQEELEDKEKAIEAELQPYKDKIISKEEQIREKRGQIDSLKSKILRGNEKIAKLLHDIIGV